jgi:hypothetical protein
MLPTLSPNRPRPAGAPSAFRGRRPVLRQVLNGLRAGGAVVTGVVVLLAWIAAGTPLRAGGEAGKAEKPRGGGKTKTGSTTAKPATEKKPSALLPFLQLPEQKDARAEVEASSLTPALKEKLLAGDPLSLAQIEELGPAGLNPELLIKCLRTSGGSYALLTPDIDRLRAAGLPDSVVDYLLTTRARRAAFYYPSLYYTSPWLHHDDHHFGDLHHGDDHFGSSLSHHH